MKICFITGESVNDVWQKDLTKIGGNDVVVFSFSGLGLVSYKKELNNETEYFGDVAKLSRQLNCVIVCGADTDTYGVFRHSAVIADRGKILGVTDMVHSVDGSEYVSGGSFRVYDTNAGKIGVIIAEDLYFPESARVLSMCDADIIICVYKKMENHMPIIMLRANAFSNGVVSALCAENYSAMANVKGEIISAGSEIISSAKIKIEKDYHLITSRRRGLYKDLSSGY